MARTVLRGDRRSNAAVLPDTGYNAALLAHRLGTGNVTSIEIDPEIAEQARAALITTGYPVTVITGDGAQGYLPHAPYEITARTSHTSVAPYSVAVDYDACLAIGMKVPGCSVIMVSDPTAELTGTLWFVDPDTDSWASLRYRPHVHTYPIHQSGPRNLWEEVETAYHWWRQAGRPGPDRWQITITPEGQQVTLTELNPAQSR